MAVNQSPMVIAIDGPAGAGKSTVTQAVAAHLGILYLDTGAMYRAATVGIIDAKIDLDDELAIASWVNQRSIGFDQHGQVMLDGVVLPDSRIRTPYVTGEVWRVANNKGCRQHLVALQQAIISGRDAALEGRDATTVICPNAPLKIYLDASPEERARRRLADWSADEAAPSLAEVAAAIQERDERDSTRTFGALKKSDEAVHVLTDGLSPAAVVATILAYAVQRHPLLLEEHVYQQLQVGRSREAGYVRVATGSPGGPAPWQLGLSNPSTDRMPGAVQDLTRNSGGRQAGVLCQGQAIIVLGGTGAEPGAIVALPMLPQTWYVIEPDCWHAVVQKPGTICAWAEASGIIEDHASLTQDQIDEVHAFCRVYLGE